MKKLPLVAETSATLPTAKLTTQQLCTFNRTHIQHQNFASSNFWHLWKTALRKRPRNFIFLSYTNPTEKLLSFPTETELFSICILIIHRIRSKRYPYKQYFTTVEKEAWIVQKQHKRCTDVQIIRFDFCETPDFFLQRGWHEYNRTRYLWSRFFPECVRGVEELFHGVSWILTESAYDMQ